jgi:hypothetical protein
VSVEELALGAPAGGLKLKDGFGGECWDVLVFFEVFSFERCLNVYTMLQEAYNTYW